MPSRPWQGRQRERKSGAERAGALAQARRTATIDKFRAFAVKTRDSRSLKGAINHPCPGTCKLLTSKSLPLPSLLFRLGGSQRKKTRLTRTPHSDRASRVRNPGFSSVKGRSAEGALRLSSRKCGLFLCAPK